MNVVVVQGMVNRSPEIRELADGSSLVLLEVSADSVGGRAVVPVVWLAPTETLPEAGAEVVVTGHVRRRFFRAGGATQSRTEVVADAVVPARARARARKAVGLALGVLPEGLKG
jgi:single-strand DNA-binding protein